MRSGGRERVGRRELAQSVRRLAERILVAAGDEAELLRAREAVDAVTARLAGPEAGASPARTLGGGASPRLNPFAPELDAELVGEALMRGRVRFGALHEGPPGHAHGGAVAYLFDALLGRHNALRGFPALTGRLRVRYRHPTPLFRELACEARIEQRVRRLVRARGRLLDGERVLAQADAVFWIAGR